MREKEVIHGKREGRKSSKAGGQAKGSVSICQHPSATAQPLGAWEAARAGAGEMGGLQELG